MVLIELAAKLLDFLGWRTVGGWGAISILIRRVHGCVPPSLRQTAETNIGKYLDSRPSQFSLSH
jgi:hypothetical protein